MTRSLSRACEVVDSECPHGSHVGGTIWEGGHFYSSKGPTAWSVKGWEILSKLCAPGDHTMVLVDDVHAIDLVNPAERNMPVIADFAPNPFLMVWESEMARMGFEVLGELQRLSGYERGEERRTRLILDDGTRAIPRRHMVRYVKNQWCCSGYPLTTVSENGSGSGKPLCLLYDLGLLVYKVRLGYSRAVNVLPAFYEKEQRALIRIARKVVPGFTIESVLYDLGGHWRYLRLEDVI